MMRSISAWFIAILQLACLLATMGILVAAGMGLCGVGLRTATVLAGASQAVFAGVLFLGLLFLLGQVAFVHGRRHDSADIDEVAAPEREFRYKRQRLGAGILYAVAVLFLAPVVGMLVYLVVRGRSSMEPALGLLALFLLVLGGAMFLIAQRLRRSRVTIFPDRMEVRGVYSNGSMRWNEARAFTHEEMANPEGVAYWAYFLSGESRSLRVEPNLLDADSFERIVEAKTGLVLGKWPNGREAKPVKRTHAAFGKQPPAR
jgi:hypothetical protein